MKIFSITKARIYLILVLSLVLTACAPAGGQNQQTTTLIYANLTEGGVDRQMVDRFNRTHEDVQIEVRDYFDEDGRSGKSRLLTAMAAGNIPDIIDLGRGQSVLPYPVLARRGFLEDIWPYIENDPDLGRAGVLEAPLRAAEVDGSLYAAFGAVSINTLIGAESVVGDRNSWTLAELLEAFSSMPEDSTILEYGRVRDYLFECLFSMSIDSYVDWETGECSFISDKFKDALQFVNNFPMQINTPEGADVNAEIVDRIFSGRQMLSMQRITGPRDLQWMDSYFGLGGTISFIGYPMEDGSIGSSFRILEGKKLAMSSTCQNKEAAWEFLRNIFLSKFKSADSLIANGCPYIPVNRADYDLLIECSTRRDMGGTVSYCTGPRVKIRKTTQDELQRFENLLNSIDKIDLYNTAIYEIVYEASEAYFAGDKTLDETVNIIQNRVSLYVNENR